MECNSVILAYQDWVAIINLITVAGRTLLTLVSELVDPSVPQTLIPIPGVAITHQQAMINAACGSPPPYPPPLYAGYSGHMVILMGVLYDDVDGDFRVGETEEERNVGSR